MHLCSGRTQLSFAKPGAWFAVLWYVVRSRTDFEILIGTSSWFFQETRDNGKITKRVGAASEEWPDHSQRSPSKYTTSLPVFGHVSFYPLRSPRPTEPPHQFPNTSTHPRARGRRQREPGREIGRGREGGGEGGGGKGRDRERGEGARGRREGCREEYEKRKHRRARARTHARTHTPDAIYHTL